ncbi:GNAT family N-acetyltransferase [Sulfitobacter sp. R86518]|uniref:GNAT family N-acetyltransferase n=1 Tax=Sulfitobacter sp. R86518 TaxID=3093858 RepID=UPI0036DF4A5F
MVQASERVLMKAICSYSESDGYRTYKAEEFPGFYAGNGLAISQPAARNIQGWVAAFHEEFPAADYAHVTLSFEDCSLPDTLRVEAEEVGFHSITEVYLVARCADVASNSLDEGFRDLSMSKPDDQSVLRLLHLDEASDQNWFEDENSFYDLFAKTVVVSRRTGISWLGIPHAEKPDQLASALGYFDAGGLCRLQDVITARDSRNRGHASALIREVARRALKRGTPTIGLAAEKGGTAEMLYERLGFFPVGTSDVLMKF